jgi:hypothetical protein
MLRVALGTAVIGVTAVVTGIVTGIPSIAWFSASKRRRIRRGGADASLRCPVPRLWAVRPAGTRRPDP